MSVKDKTILWFQDIGKRDLLLAGGKGANLGELTKAGIPVPPGFVVSADSYSQFLQEEGLQEPIRRLLEGMDYEDSTQLQQTATKVKDLLLSKPMPADIAAQIRQAYEKMGGGYVAVRSSATAEDLPEASFAGQQSTFLNVRGPDSVVQAIKACWASLFEARAIYYRFQNGFDHFKVKIAVPVQHMVESHSSGVMFTLEPVSSDQSKILVEAVWGLGEAIVSGEETPDSYLVEKETLAVLQRETAHQERQLVRNPGATTDNETANLWSPVPPERKDQPKLTDKDLQALAQIGRRIENHYGFPQDIEWAKEGDKLYILQTRPVTTIREGAAPEQGDGFAGAKILLQGSPASPGVEVGPVKIIVDATEIHKVKQGDVLVAQMTTPDFVPAMKRAAAIVTDRGGRTCHAAIVSRELGIPCVVGTGNATQTLKPRQIVTVDGGSGRIYQGRVAVARQAQRAAPREAIKTKTRLYVNLAQPELAERTAARDVDGVGLLRAEFIIAQIGEHPKHMLEQGRGQEFTKKLAQGIATFAQAFSPRPVVYRTSDYKTNEYRNLVGGSKYEEVEENPMIGYRGASRYLLDLPSFKLEMEAIKRVRAQHKNLWVMIPFVRTVDELRQVKALLTQEGLVQGPDFKLWMMVEVPSNILILDKFLDQGIDGISIGSNDLTQLILGVDRDNSRFAQLFDERNEAVVLALEKAIKTCAARGVTSSICGQAPSDYPELAEKLVEWGITSVSVNPDRIDDTRVIIAGVEHRLGRSPS
ncbi:MAG: phosphoenolpyruvate synthase [Chloroflexi bacterium]|nr:phosphoenolpyruvate synthase [Chloroflexota bacterium]